ncbi:MAG: thioredoxin family protein [Anaerolineae bacterium]|jgi:small redox-active disulfide protein 2
MEVKVLGTGCPKCKRLERVTRETLAEMGVEATVTKVTDMVDILSYNVPATPGLVIDGAVVSYGRIPQKAELTSIIATTLSKVEE